MLIFGFFFMFVACIVYMHADLTISKSSASYVAKLQWDEVLWMGVVQYFLHSFIWIWDTQMSFFSGKNSYSADSEHH